MPAQALNRATPRPQQETEHRPAGPDLGVMPDLAQGIDPLMAARLQGVLGNEALAALTQASQNKDMGKVFELSRHAPTTALPHKEKMDRSFGEGAADDVQVQQGEEAEAVLGVMNARSAYHDGVILLRRGATPEEVGHELAHAQQEQGSTASKGSLDGGGADASEKEAAEAGKAAANGEEVGELQQGLTADVHRWGIGNLWDGAKKLASGAVDTVGEAAKGVWNTGKSAVSGAVNTVATAGQGLWNTGKAAVSGTWDTMKAAGTGLLDTGKAAVGGLWDTAKAAGSGLLDTGKAAVGGLWDTTKAAGGGLINTLGAGWDGLKGVWDARGEGLGGMLSAAGSGLMNTGKAALGGTLDTLKAGGGGLLDTLKAGGGGLLDTLKAGGGGLLDTLKAGGSGLLNTAKAAGGGLLDTLQTAGGGIWDTIKSVGSGLKDTALTGLDGLARTGLAAGKGLWDTAQAALPDSWAKKLDGWVAGATKGVLDFAFENWPKIKSVLPSSWLDQDLEGDSHDRQYSSAPRSSVDNKYTSAMDIPGTTKEFKQQFSPLGIPLTDDAWAMQNEIDGGALQKLHDNTFLRTLADAGVMDQLVKSGDISADEATQDLSTLSQEDLHELVRKVDDAGATQAFFASMDPQQYTAYQSGILDAYIEMANKDPKNSAVFLDLLPTELEGSVVDTLDELGQGQQPNDFRAGGVTSLSRQASVEAAKVMREQGKSTYGLVVPFSNSAENIIHNDGVAEDGVDNLSNYLRQLDPSTTTMANGYSQSGNAVLHYANRKGGTEGLDYVGAMAPMGGADMKGGNGVWSGTMRSGENDPGVQVMGITHQDDPAQYIHTNEGMTNFYWSMLNFNFTHRGQDQIHGGFPGPVPDPQNGTTGYPMNASKEWMARMLNGEFQGQDYQRRADWTEDRRKK